MSAGKRIPNIELVVAAVHQLEGRTQVVDTEDVAVVVEKLAPGRFSWRKYKDRTDLELVRSNLKHATEESNGALLTGSKSKGWVLTEAGRARASNLELDHADLTGVVMTEDEKRLERWLKRERQRMLSSDTFRLLKENGVSGVTSDQVQAFFQVDEYITGDSRKRKIDRLLNAFGGDPELGEAVKELASKLGEEE